MLVILAILAAIMIPALTGWIDKAKEKQVMLDARNVEMAAQAGLYQAYATDTAFVKMDTDADLETTTPYGLDAYISSICGTTWGTNATATAQWNDKADVTIFVYTDTTAKYKAVYMLNAGKIGNKDYAAGWTIEKTS